MSKHREIFFFSLIIMRHICVVMSSKYLTGLDMQNNNTEKCIVHILSSKTQFNSVLFVVNNDLLTNDLLREIHSVYNVKVCVKDHNVSLEVIPNAYLIYVRNRTFEDLIDKIDRDWYREPEALYIIIVRDITEDNLEPVFSILWEHHLIHVLVLVNVTEDEAAVYTYFPYAEGQCGQAYNNIVKLCDCTDVKEIDIVEKLHEYDKPLLKNCTLNVATRNYPPLVICNPDDVNKHGEGIERFLVDLLLERENISLNYTCLPETDDVGNISDNFTVSGMMGMLYENEVDLLFGGFSLNNRRANFFDYLCVHLAYEDTFIPVTPCANLMERWKMVYIMFHTNVWLLFLLIFVLCAMLLSDFSYMRLVSTTDRNISELLNLFGNATQNISLALREKLFKNFVIVHWLWFIFLMNCFYQTRLTSFTTYRLYKPQLNEYSSLRDYNFTPCLPWDVILYLKNSGQVPIINEEYVQKDNCETADSALDEVAKSSNKYTVTMYLQYLWWVRKNPKEKMRIHLMKENFYNNLYAVFFKRGFPLLQAFTAKMLRLPEHGFVHGAKDFHRIPRELDQTSNVEFIHTSLKLDDLTVPFGILIIGFVFASVVFAVELLLKSKVQIENFTTTA